MIPEPYHTHSPYSRWERDRHTCAACGEQHDVLPEHDAPAQCRECGADLDVERELVDLRDEWDGAA